MNGSGLKLLKLHIMLWLHQQKYGGARCMFHAGHDAFWDGTGSPAHVLLCLGLEPVAGQAAVACHHRALDLIG